MDSTRTMITFKTGNVRFTYRVGGIVIHNGRVLCQEAHDAEEPSWFLIGGRAELREAAEETLKREMQEELGEEATIERLLYVVENFFTYSGIHYHELGLYFLLSFPPDSPLYQAGESFTRQEDGVELTFRWLPIDKLPEFTLYPTFFKQALQALPEQVTHIVHYNE